MTELAGYIIAAKVVVLVLGGLITHLAYRAYSRTGTPELRWFSVGFGIITLGALIGGLLDIVLGVRLATGVFVESILLALGFAVLAHALYARANGAAQA
jgi:uncharacterized membrane-anchored protein